MRVPLSSNTLRWSGFTALRSRDQARHAGEGVSRFTASNSGTSWPPGLICRHSTVTAGQLYAVGFGE
jgi:hypothetical protein